MILWHNPRCSKSRETLTLLTDAGHTPDIRLYLTDIPSEAEIRDVAAKLRVAPIDMMRTKETAFKDLGLSKTSTDDALFAAMAKNPVLIERPILITQSAAAIGRPPQNVLNLVSSV